MLKDEDYNKAMKSLEQNRKNSYDTLSQEEGGFEYSIRLWFLCSHRISICETEYDSNVASQIGEDKPTEQNRTPIW
jgi:hypothetical protein